MSNATLLKEIRETLCLTQQVLANELGVSFSTINRWENGAHTPSKMGQRAIREYCEKKQIVYLIDRKQ